VRLHPWFRLSAPRCGRSMFLERSHLPSLRTARCVVVAGGGSATRYCSTHASHFIAREAAAEQSAVEVCVEFG
jgi:hypothetical protein